MAEYVQESVYRNPTLYYEKYYSKPDTNINNTITPEELEAGLESGAFTDITTQKDQSRDNIFFYSLNKNFFPSKTFYVVKTVYPNYPDKTKIRFLYYKNVEESGRSALLYNFEVPNSRGIVTLRMNVYNDILDDKSNIDDDSVLADPNADYIKKIDGNKPIVYRINFDKYTFPVVNVPSLQSLALRATDEAGIEVPEAIRSSVIRSEEEPSGSGVGGSKRRRRRRTKKSKKPKRGKRTKKMYRFRRR